MAIIEPSGVQQAGTLLAQSAVAVSHTGDTNEAVLATIAVPANAIGKNGQLSVRALFSYTNSANNKTASMRYGAAGSGLSGTLAAQSIVTTTSQFQTLSGIYNRNATNSQLVPATNWQFSFVASGTAVKTLAIDTTAATEINLTGQLALAAETVTLECYQVLLYFHA